MKKPLYISVFLVSTLVACSSTVTTTFTPTGESSYPSRNEDCSITLYTKYPNRPYEELGVIDINVNRGFSVAQIRKASDVKKLVEPDACKAGGNAIVLWGASGGEYSKVTVLKI